MRRGEEIEATDVSSGGNADLAMVTGQERQRGLIERDILCCRHRVICKRGFDLQNEYMDNGFD